MIEPDLFDGNDVVGHLISGFVDHSIGALAYLVNPLVSLRLRELGVLGGHV